MTTRIEEEKMVAEENTIQQSNDAAVVVETLPNHEVVESEIQPSNEVVMMREPQTFDDISENELANPSTDVNNQLSHQETIPSNECIDIDMLLEPGPLSESLPYSETLQTYDRHTNEDLAGFEALSQEQLANAQMLMAYYDQQENNEAMHIDEPVVISSQEHNELPISDATHDHGITNAETPLRNEAVEAETRPRKQMRKRSNVWQHFSLEEINPGCQRARCNQCSHSFAYSTGSKAAGTSHLKRHIARGTCSTIRRETSRSNPYTQRSSGVVAANASEQPMQHYRLASTPSTTIYNQDHCRREIAKMIIMHDYPLHMVEHPGFVAFAKSLQPQFEKETFNTIQGECVAAYQMEKQNLNKCFEELQGRVSLTLDTWTTSSRSSGYVFITAHFIDNDWKLQRRILNVVMEPFPGSDSALIHAVSACIADDWSMLKGGVFTFTCNQAFKGDGFENLRPLLSVKNVNLLNGQLLLSNCIAATFSDIANELFASTEEVILKVRETVKYVMASSSNTKAFSKLKQQLDVPSERSLVIDDKCQWNTTYQMLKAASDLKIVFMCLDINIEDCDYKGALSETEWKVVDQLCESLKPIYDAATSLQSTTNGPAAIKIFNEAWTLKSNASRAAESGEPLKACLNRIIDEKIGNYWRDCSLVLALAVVMDPRFKMKLVEFRFNKMYGNDAEKNINIVKDGVREMFHEYEALALTPTYDDAEEGSVAANDDVLSSDNGLTNFDIYVMETTRQHQKSEIDSYLEGSLLPRVPGFNVLEWWSENKAQYPTLWKMAKDILAIPIAAVQSDGFFYRKNREMDEYRSSLKPQVVEALICSKDWIQYREANEEA